MSRFTAHLGLQMVEDGEGRPILRGGRCQWIVRGALRYEVGCEGSGRYVLVPDGALTDLASIPRAFWTLLPPDGPWLKAAVVHDHLYRQRGVTDQRAWTRREADEILREAMGVLGVPAWKRGVIFAAVRIGGAAGWGR